ncbi:LPXTG-motif cell wall anchor domain protein [Pyrobaculum islandicum DSM 4184]|uniref:LPXTG-motif cell wall anchor domain protein n=1 Tax=Pyrobaculum islandicum (strain DSM 4184 / JCM 9189 / GEO3) TaxID=384616 RepID=A1RT07_PYRIL|nr:ABC transporter substrate-binding protein [Pyrobaculum islandicum]ABL88089.1 LPXTG-motif cell wall anchor domain protein [Pyrobaculum islandicum DSM 4184]
MRLRTVLLAMLLGIVLFAQYTPPHTNPGPATDRIVGKSVPIAQAGAAAKAGDIDVYIFGMRAAQAAPLKGDPSVVLYTAAAGFNDIILNPAPSNPPCANPFSSRAIRYAMQFVIDRDYVANEIFKGFAVPMYIWLSQYDPTYSIVADIISQLGIRYDLDYAKTIVESEMPKLGATKGPDGKWYCKGKLVTVIGLIRVEDERKDIGDAFASALEQLGFTVDRKYVTFDVAIQTVYGTDPAQFQWHFYTEGWGKSGIDRWDTSSIAQYCASWFGYMPGWGTTGWYNFANATIDEITDKLYKGKYASFQEYIELYRKATLMCIQESVRVFVNTNLNAFVASPQLKGVTVDLGAGLRASVYNARNWYVPGKDVVNVGHLWVWTASSAWNPVPQGGFTDVYSVDWFRMMYDPAVWNHPFTGEPMPFRATYVVETKGPAGYFDVPADAYRWDAKQKAWVSAGGAKAKSKVVFNYAKYIGAKWHHGQPIKLADVLFIYAFLWDIANDPQKVARESGVASYVNSTMNLIKGIRIINDTSIEVYIDYWHFDPNYIAAMAVTTPDMPWEVYYAVDQLVYVKQTYAASRASATKYNVPWLSLILKDHAKAAADVLQDALNKGIYPESWFKIGDKTLLTKDEALARYRAAVDWFNKYSHMIISQGPFYLYAIDTAKQYIELRAYRDPSYPYKPGAFYFGVATPVSVKAINVPTVVVGQPATISVSLEVPSGAGRIYYKWGIVDPTTGRFLYMSEEGTTAAAPININVPADVSSKLTANRAYKFWVLTYAENVPIVSEATQVFIPKAAAPATTPTPTPTTPPPATTPTPPQPTVVTTTAPATGTTEALAAAIVGILAVLVALAFALRKKSGETKQETKVYR